MFRDGKPLYLKLIYKFSALPINISEELFEECDTMILKLIWKIKGSRITKKDFPGGPVVKTPHFQCRGPGFNPWLGN